MEIYKEIIADNVSNIKGKYKKVFIARSALALSLGELSREQRD